MINTQILINLYKAWKWHGSQNRIKISSSKEAAHQEVFGSSLASSSSQRDAHRDKHMLMFSVPTLQAANKKKKVDTKVLNQTFETGTLMWKEEQIGVAMVGNAWQLL